MAETLVPGDTVNEVGRRHGLKANHLFSWRTLPQMASMVKNEPRKDPFTRTVFVFRAKTADRLKLLYRDGTGLVMACKRLEEHRFTCPAVKDGLMLMNHAELETLYAGLDCRRVRAIEAKAPEAVE